MMATTALEPITPVSLRFRFRVGGSHRRRGFFWSLGHIEILCLETVLLGC